MDGTLYGTEAQGIELKADWSAVYNVNTMKATITISVYMIKVSSGIDDTFVARIRGGHDWNYIKLNDTVVAQYARNDGAGTQENPYYVYTTTSNPYEGEVKLYNNYDGHDAWCKSKAHYLTNYQFEVPISESTGLASFTIDARLTYYMDSQMTLLNTTVTTTTPADLYSKVSHKTNNIWTTNGRIWHKEGNQWVRKYLYKKTSSGWIKK